MRRDWAAGQRKRSREPVTVPAVSAPREKPLNQSHDSLRDSSGYVASAAANGDHYVELGHLFADVLERGWKITHGQKPRSYRTPSDDYRRGVGPARNRSRLR